MIAAEYTAEINRSLMCAIESLHPVAKCLCYLVITRCDGFTDDDRQEIVSDFRREDVCRDVATFVGEPIYTVGFSSVNINVRRASNLELKQLSPKMRKPSGNWW